MSQTQHDSAASPAAGVPTESIAEFCRRWKVTVFELFGEAAAGDLGAGGEVGAMVTFSADARPSLWDVAAMQDELAGLFRHPVSLTTRRAMESADNPHRRRAVLGSARVVYAQ